MFVCGPIGHFNRKIRVFMCIFTPSMVLFTRHLGLQQSTADSLCPHGPVEVYSVYSSTAAVDLYRSTAVYSLQRLQQPSARTDAYRLRYVLKAAY